jgi:dihydropteroate synthase
MAFVRRKPAFVAAAQPNLPLGQRTMVMGVLNITPDSFSGDGLLADQEPGDRALGWPCWKRARRSSISAESRLVRGSVRALPADEEIGRVLAGDFRNSEATAGSGPLDRHLQGQTAKAAVAAGAEIVNDVSGFLWDEAMASTCASFAAEWC